MSVPLKVVTVGDKTSGCLVLDGARTAYCQGKHILRDEATLVEFGVNSAGDMAKGFAATVGASGMAVAAGALTGGSILAAGFVFVVAAYFIGNVLNDLDTQYGYSKKLTQEMERLLK